MTDTEKTRYSDTELEEFRALLNEKQLKVDLSICSLL